MYIYVCIWAQVSMQRNTFFHGPMDFTASAFIYKYFYAKCTSFLFTFPYAYPNHSTFSRLFAQFACSFVQSKLCRHTRTYMHLLYKR